MPSKNYVYAIAVDTGIGTLLARMRVKNGIRSICRRGKRLICKIIGTVTRRTLGTTKDCRTSDGWHP